MSEVDWNGGLEPALEYMFAERPADPEMRESASVWLFDEQGRFAFPRMGIEVVGNAWDSHRMDCNFAFADGRVMRDSRHATSLPTLGAAGLHSVLGTGDAAGKLSFECLEPFHKWRVIFEGNPRAGHVLDQIERRFAIFADRPAELLGDAFPPTPTRLEVELTMAVPAWTQDYRPDKIAAMSEAEKADAGLMGFGYRVEQLFRAEGEYTVAGTTTAFRGQGSRIKRQSVRPMGTFRGHCWQSAVFPNGRAFAHITYPPREDGTTYANGFVYVDGVWHSAKAKTATTPFLRKIMPRGDDVSVELEYAGGSVRIEGTTEMATFHIGNPGVNGMNNQQGAVRYRWGGQEAFGMIERSSPAALCEIVG